MYVSNRFKTFTDPRILPKTKNLRKFYDKLRPYSKYGRTIEKVSFKNIHNHSYTWNIKNYLYRDRTDEESVLYHDIFETIATVYSWTDHSSYHGIFRVTLEDVIKVGVEDGVFNKYKDVDEIYVTSYPYNIYGDIDDMGSYDSRFDMHRVKTVFKIKKKIIIPKKEDTSVNDPPPKKRICKAKSEDD